VSAVLSSSMWPRIELSSVAREATRESSSPSRASAAMCFTSSIETLIHPIHFRGRHRRQPDACDQLIHHRNPPLPWHLDLTRSRRKLYQIQTCHASPSHPSRK